MSLSPTNRMQAHRSSSSVSLSRALVSGALVQFCEVSLLGHLLDRVKTAQQALVSPVAREYAHRHGLASLLHQKPQSPPRFWDVFQGLYRHGGWGEIYAGYRWNILSQCGKSSFRWVSIGVISDSFRQFDSLSPWTRSIGVAVSIALAESTLWVTPLESLKTKDMTSAFSRQVRSVASSIHGNDPNQRLSGSLCTALHNAKSSTLGSPDPAPLHGFRVLIHGWIPIVCKQSIAWISFLGAYDALKRGARWYVFGPHWRDLPDDKLQLPFLWQVSVSGVASAFSVGVTQPLDTLKTYAQGHWTRNMSYMDAMKYILSHRGLRGLYAGWQVKLARSAWHSVVTLTAIERLGIMANYG